MFYDNTHTTSLTGCLPNLLRRWMTSWSRKTRRRTDIMVDDVRMDGIVEEVVLE